MNRGGRGGLNRMTMHRYDPGMVRVCLRQPLKRLAGDRAEHALEGSTVGELLGELEREQPPLGGWILDERGHIRRHINVFVNGERGDQDTAVSAGDRVDVLPAISGGAA
jgi:molybdopterin synthase sulfur carrier subunit